MYQQQYKRMTIWGIHKGGQGQGGFLTQGTIYKAGRENIFEKSGQGEGG